MLFWTSPILGVAFFLLFWQRFILFCGMVLFQETILHYIESLSFLDVENAFLRESDVSRQLGEEKINLRCKTCKFTAAKTTQILFLCALLEPRNTILMLMFFAVDCVGALGVIQWVGHFGDWYWRILVRPEGASDLVQVADPLNYTHYFFTFCRVSTYSRAKSPIIFQPPKILLRCDLSKKKTNFDLTL